jgi:hypothetical protein
MTSTDAGKFKEVLVDARRSFDVIEEYPLARCGFLHSCGVGRYYFGRADFSLVSP